MPRGPLLIVDDEPPNLAAMRATSDSRCEPHMLGCFSDILPRILAAKTQRSAREET